MRPAARPTSCLRLALTAMALSGALLGATAAAAADGADLPSPSAPPGGLFAVTPAPPCAEPLCFTANSGQPGVPSLTASRTHMVAINPDIVTTTRGVSHISAERSEEEGADIGDSQWVFTGHVRADMPDGQLRSDTATVRIVDRRIASISAQGDPALFQRPASATPAPLGNAPATPGAAGAAGQKASLANVTVRGHAQSITYDAAHEQVQFSGDSWFTDGCNEITGQLVTYDLATRTVQAGAKPGGSARVHLTVRNTRPGSSTDCTAHGTARGARP